MRQSTASCLCTSLSIMHLRFQLFPQSSFPANSFPIQYHRLRTMCPCKKSHCIKGDISKMSVYITHEPYTSSCFLDATAQYSYRLTIQEPCNSIAYSSHSPEQLRDSLQLHQLRRIKPARPFPQPVSPAAYLQPQTSGSISP